MKMSRKEKPLVLLFDGNALVHRAFHALPPLTVSKTGEIVNAVYGFASTLLKVIAELKPTYWAIAFDRPTPTFRHQKFEDYKAQRPATPEELKNQIKRVHQLVDAFHIPVFEIDGFEADDVLGTLGKQAAEQGVETIIVSGDNDMLQLVAPGVRMLAPRRAFGDSILYDEEAVKQKYSIRPSQITDLKALTGDPSDNIPGIPGIGEKTAVKLLQQFGSLEGIYAHIEGIAPNRLQSTLREHESQALQSKELVTVSQDVPVKLDLQACQMRTYSRNEVVELFRELEFVNLIPRLPQEIAGPSGMLEGKALPKGICQLVNTETALNEVVRQLEGTNVFAIDLQTAGKEVMTADLVGVAVSPASGKAFYIPLGHRGLGQPEQLPVGKVIAKLKPLLASQEIGKIAHNGKYIMTVLGNHGVELENLSFDTTIAAYLTGEKSLGLKALAFNRLGIEMTSITDLVGTGKKQISIAMLEARQAADYACASSDVTWGLSNNLRDELERLGLWQLFDAVEMPLVPVLVDMERNGVVVDSRLLREMSFELNKKMLELEAQIYNSVGHKFNINSHQQLGMILFEELKLPRSRKTKSGYSTEASVIEGLRGSHHIIELVLDYRQLSKLKSTYVDALPALINPGTGRVHTSFNQTATTTGRLSSTEPNLQNIPIRGELGGKIRQAIIAPQGSYLLSGDYSQIDLRALAHLSQDPELIAAFARDEDIHAITASRIYGVGKAEVTSEMRRVAKTVNFGVIYGMSDYGLEQATELSREEAAQFIALYFERYTRVKEYIEATKEQARKMGYVQTLMGRRRFIPEINSPNWLVRQAAERMAINAPVQGTSADIIKVAMINMHRETKNRNLKSKMLLQIHDELLFEVPQEEIGEMKSLVARIMPEAMKLCVPLKVDIKIGKNWAEMA
jgi:DNA polymerase-1